MRTSRRAALALLAPLAVAIACGGGGGASIGGGIGGTSAVYGPITGFGSVIVGDIEFDTDRATVVIDGDPAAATELELGMVVAVRGVVAPGGKRGVADSVVSDALLQGPIETVDLGSSSLTALRQIVLVDAATVFDPVPLSALAPGDRIRVSGLLDAQGRIHATRIELAATAQELEVKGFIQDLDPGTPTFRINALRVDYREALIEHAPDGLQNGLFVEVDLEAPPLGDVARALGVNVIDPQLMADPGDGLKVEGFVTSIVSDTEFVVGVGQRVRIDGSTRFENGRPGDIAIDTQVDVTGVAGTDGALLATEVELVLP